ncbi:13886_t:CDS:1, partial [Racocetra persica]
RGHDENSDETQIHHSSHQPGGLKGTRSVSTGKLTVMACHNRPDSKQMHYKGTQKAWSDAKSTDLKDWKFGPHYMTDFNEIMCWFFEMLHEDFAEKLEKFNFKPADESELEKH